MGLRGQSVIDETRRLIDGFLDYFKPVCESPVTTCTHGKKIRGDLIRVRFLDKEFNSMTHSDEFIATAARCKFTQTGVWVAGKVTRRQFRCFDAARYLDIALNMTEVAGMAIYKEASFQTLSSMKCGHTGEKLTPYMDFVYLSGKIVGEMNFRLRGCASCVDLDEVVYKSRQVYDRLEVPDWMVSLISHKRYATMVDLLYAPNSISAIDAYEALLFLTGKHLVEEDERMLQKNREVSAGDVPIDMSCGSDCITNKYSYKSLDVSSKEIIDKYEKAINHSL
jgi:hypothetical protein